MREFLHGWKRKAGVVALLMACLFTVGWIRSMGAEDWLMVYLCDSFWLQLASGSRGIVIERSFEPLDPPPIGGPVFWGSSLHNSARIVPILVPLEEESRFRTQEWSADWAMPYVSIVIPLTLLSAYLLLSKPRRLAPKQATDPAPTTGA